MAGKGRRYAQRAGGDITGRDKVGGDRVAGHKITVIGQLPHEASPRRRVPTPNVPALPARFVARPELLAEAKAALLAPSACQGARMVGLVGMGGAGKSVLARALARDEEVCRAFPDGIVWLELGPEPDLAARQAQLLEAFGDSRAVVDAQLGLARLHQLVHQAACLLVLDNVWEREHLRAFELLEPASALLVTSRDGDVLDTSAATCRVGPLQGEPARRLLALSAGQDPASLPAEAHEVADECGGLPLALAIAGGLVANGRSWRNVRERLWRADLDKLESRFHDYPYPSLLAALEASVSALAAEQRARYLELGVFEGRGQVPAEVVRWLWQQSGLDDLDGEDLVALLGRLSLVQHDRVMDTVTLHDLQFDYVRREAGRDRLLALHARLASDFLDGWAGLDQGLPGLRAAAVGDDAVERYGLLHVVAHLTAAGHEHAVHRLLALEWGGEMRPGGGGRGGNAWYLAHEWAGEIAAYMQDVRLAWRLAEAATDRALAEGGLAASIGLELRYGLVGASIASIAASIPRSLLAALVDNQVWTPAQALAYAREVPIPGAKARTLAELASHLPEAQRSRVLAEALNVARTIEYPYSCAQVLAELAPRLPPALLLDALGVARTIDDPDGRARSLTVLLPLLPEAQRPGVLADGLGAASAIPILYSRATALAALLPGLPEAERLGPLADVLDAARTVNDSTARAWTLAELAPFLPAELVPDALDVAGAIEEPDGRAEALAALLPLLPEAERQGVLAAALDAARTIDEEDSEWRAEALAELAPHLPAELVPVALDLARAVDDPDGRARALAAVASHVAADLLLGALQTARTIDSPFWLSRALVELAPRLPPDLLRDALRAAYDIDDPSVQVEALAALVPHLPEAERPSVLDDALEAAYDIDDPHVQVEALVALVAHLPAADRPSVLADALHTVRLIDFPPWQSESLAELAPHLPAGLLPEALELTRSLADPDDRSQVLDALAPHLPASLLPDALELARTLDDPFWRARARAALAVHLPEAERRGVLGDALRTARLIRDESWRARALAALVPHLRATQRPRVLAEAFEALRTVEIPGWESQDLAQLAPYLPEALLPDALDVAGSLVFPGERAHALARLAPHLPETLLGAAIDVARTIDKQEQRADALAGLAPNLPAALLVDALDVAWAMDSDVRARGLAALVPHLPEAERPVVLADALDVARTVRNPYSRVRSLAALVPHLPEAERPVVLADALDVARSISDAHWRMEAMTVLVPHLPEAERPTAIADALGAARTLGDPHEQGSVVATLAPYLPVALLPSALDCARTIDGPDGRAHAIGAIVQAWRDKDSLRWDADWRPVFATAAPQGRETVAADVAASCEAIARFGGVQAIRAIHAALQDVERWWP